MVVKAGKCTSAAIFAGLGCRVVSDSVGFARNCGARYERGVDLPERICAVMRWVARSKGLSHNFAKCVHYAQASARPSRRCPQTLARHRRAIFWQGNVLTFAVRKNRGQLSGLHADLPPIPLHDLRHAAPRSGNGLEAISISTPGSVLTVDAYTGVLPDLAHHAAESLSWASTSPLAAPSDRP